MTTCGLPIQVGEIVLTADDLDDLTIDCTSGFVATELQVGFPGPRPVVRPRAIGDGLIDNSAYLGNRAITLSLTLDTSISPPQTLVDQLLPFLAQTRRPRLAWRMGDTPDTSSTIDNRWRSAIVRGTDAPLVISGPRYWTIVLSFVTVGAYLESVDANSVAVLSSTVGSVAVTNSGNAPAPWVMTAIAPAANPSRDYDFSFPGVGTWSIAAYLLPAGYTLEIDVLARTILSKVGGVVQDNVYPYLSAYAFDWKDLYFAPGTSNIDFSLSPPSPAMTATFTWRDTWL